MLKTLATLSLAGLASASPLTKRWTQSSADCWSFTQDIYAEAQNGDLQSVIGGAPANQQVLVQGTIETFQAGSTVNAQIAAAPKIDVKGSYGLYFEYCQPKTGTPAGVFQTHHGLVGNVGYWNVKVDGHTDNSFAESAAAAGWATLSYDRLGVGRSAHPDGIQVVQQPYEIAESIAIAGKLRDGSLGYAVPQFSTVVGVGHSYGSNLLAGVAGTAPDTFDIQVLTGFTGNATSGPLGLAAFQSTIASVAYPSRFANLNSTYVITPNPTSDQLGFFHYPNYTQTAFDLFTATKGEYSLGQQNSIAGPLAYNRTGYSKPTLVVTGENDAPYCASNCLVTSLGANATQLDTSRPLFPSVADADFATYVVPATGHGINFHTTAYDAYQQIISFVTSHL